MGREDGNTGESWRWDEGPLSPGAVPEGGPSDSRQLRVRPEPAGGWEGPGNAAGFVGCSLALGREWKLVL